MKTFKITLEIELKDDSIKHSDFIYEIIEQALETDESLLDYELLEVLP